MRYEWFDIEDKEGFIIKLIEDTNSKKIHWIPNKKDIWKSEYICFIPIPKTKKYLKIELTIPKQSSTIPYLSTKYSIDGNQEIHFYIIYDINSNLIELSRLVESKTNNNIIMI